MADESDYEEFRRRRFGDIPESPEEREYATRIERKARPSLAARDDDPQLSVSTVAEFVFCRRAAVLTHEGNRDYAEDELPSLALLPWFERDAIEEKYNLSVYALCAMPVVLIVGAVIVSLFMLSQVFYPVVLGAWLLSWLYVAIRVYFWWRTLGKRRLEAMHAVKCEPDPDQLTFQDVDWWGLLEAGYEVDRPEIMEDGDWKVNGKPRRIIRKGALSIPVHRINRNHGPLQPQQLVRVTGYCHLIEAMEGASSPFAIVLFGDTYKGTTVPNTSAHREQFYSALEEVRTLIRDAISRRSDPPTPLKRSICSRCPFGRPRPAAKRIETMRYDDPLEPYLIHNGKRFFHCDCGDRFKWKPEHEIAAKMHRAK